MKIHSQHYAHKYKIEYFIFYLPVVTEGFSHSVVLLQLQFRNLMSLFHQQFLVHLEERLHFMDTSGFTCALCFSTFSVFFFYVTTNSTAKSREETSEPTGNSSMAYCNSNSWSTYLGMGRQNVLTLVSCCRSHSACFSSRARLFSLVWLLKSFFLLDSILLHLSFSSSFVFLVHSGT